MFLQENEKVLKGQLEELEKRRAENNRRFELGLLPEVEMPSDEPENPMFEARHEPVKKHAVNMKSSHVKEIFASPSEEEEQQEEYEEEIDQN